MVPLDRIIFEQNSFQKVLLHRINAFTLCVKRDYLVDATITIQKCVDVRFYFCASMKNVSIEGCKDSTFVLAAVSGITRINDCTNCTFIVSTRVIHALNLVDCKCKFFWKVAIWWVCIENVADQVSVKNTMKRSNVPQLQKDENFSKKYRFFEIFWKICYIRSNN